MMNGEELLTKELIARMCKDELRLKRRFGIRVHVDKLAANKDHVLCTAWRTGLPLLQSRMDAYEIVDLAHDALRSLHQLGLQPLIGIAEKEKMSVVPPIVKSDPFHVLAALRQAAEAGDSEGIMSEETNRRASLLTRHQLVK